MKEVNSKLIYIDSIARIYGETYDFGIEIPSSFTTQSNKNNLITLSLVDAQIRSTFYNIRESNNKFYLVNYDITLGSYGGNTPVADWKVVPSLTASWSPDTPNHYLIEIEIGNYDIYGLAQAIQNALNSGYNGASTPVNTNSFPNSELTSVTMLDTLGVERTWYGAKWFPEVGGVGQGLSWTISWEATTGKMRFEYTGGQATTNLAFDFRTEGGFIHTDFYDSQNDTGVRLDIQNGAFELLGFDRHGFQSGIERRGNPPQAEWLGGVDTMEVGMAVTGVTNATNPVGGTIPYPMYSDHPCLIGAPKSIFINTNLPLHHLSAYRKVGQSFGVATEINTEFNNSTIFAKIMNKVQYYSTIVFQSQGEDDYVLKTEDLQFLNTLRFWLSDEWGYLLEVQHDWSMTLKWTESQDLATTRNKQLEKMNEMLQLLLLQKETEGIPLEQTIVTNPNEMLLAPNEKQADEAKEKIADEKALASGKEGAFDMMNKKLLTKDIDDRFKKSAIFGDYHVEDIPYKSYADEGGENTGFKSVDNWIREYKPGHKGDGGDLFSGERHLRHIKNGRITKLPYSFAGPGTHYKKRIKRGDMGINQIDIASKDHDRVYADPLATIDEIKKADIILEQTAKAVAKKHPELWADAMVVANAMRAKRVAGNLGLVKWNLFAEGGKK